MNNWGGNRGWLVSLIACHTYVNQENKPIEGIMNRYIGLVN